MEGVPNTLKIYLDRLFAELNKKYGTSVFSYSIGYASAGYSRVVCFSAGKSEYLFSLCCCENEDANPAHLFFGAYIIDALEEELRLILSERGGDFFIQSDAPLFRGASPDRAVDYLRRLAEHHLEEDLYCSYGILFDVIDCLSLTDYEQERAKGTLLFLPAPQEGVEHLCVWSVSGRDRVECSMKQLRVLRKFLAGTASDGLGDVGSALLFVRERELPIFYGAIALGDDLSSSVLQFRCVQVRINGPLRWELSLFGKLVCCRDISGLCLPNGFDYSSGEWEAEERIRNVFRSAFTRSDSVEAVERNLDRLTRITMSVRKQRHGAALVVADWDREPCRTTLDRLKRHRKAVPVSFTALEDRSTAITCAAKMDGAVLADIRSGQIVALAVILDGESCIKGDTSRGARYNSIANTTRLLRFSDTEPEVVSFVFSSDGGMDILS